jgi:hypothetical protein
MPWAESRILLAERSIEDLYRRLLDLADQLKWLRQKLQALERELPGAGAAPSAGYFGCTLSAALAHGTQVTGQTVWKLESGARTDVGTAETIYNDAPRPADDIASGSQIILAANDDGTYTVVSVPC